MVTIAKGSFRYVVLLPRMGVVLKIPHMRWKNTEYFWKATWNCMRMGRWDLVRKRFRLQRKFTVEHYGSLKSDLGKGIADNWRERQAYKYGVPPVRMLFQPTYFSFFGLLNVQRYGTVVAEAEDVEAAQAMFDRFYAVAGEPVGKDGHHFFNASNFTNADGQIKLLDYGAPRTQQIVCEFALKLLRDMKPL